MTPTPPARRLRLGLPRRAFSQVLLMQVTIAAGVAVLATGLFLAPLSGQLDHEAMRRALSIAQTTAQDPHIAEGVQHTAPTRNGPVQKEAERIRRATHAEYVVVMDTHGVRWSHPTAPEIGRVVSTSPADALAGKEVMEIDQGTLGRSARGKVPLYDAGHRIVGAVSVGIAYDSVRARLISAIPGLFAYAGGALGAGALAAWLISRRVQRQTRDLAFSDISALLAEREAMLHGIREGVVALDRGGRVRLLNDEARRLLGIGDEAVGRSPDEALGEGRTTDVLAGRVTGTDLLTVRGQRVLIANRMPTGDGGAVATLRDRTELEQLGRELDSTRGLIDALRAQDHEHANRMHTLLGLLELEMYDDAVEFVGEVVGDHRVTAEQVTEKIQDPLLAALLVGKATVAAERGVALWVSERTRLPDRLIDPRGLVTVVGNLVDNALDAVAGTLHARVEVELHSEGRTVVLRVRDTGPGVPAEQRELVFTEGWSTKEPPAHGKRGIGLSLVRRLAERQGGRATVGSAGGRRRGVHRGPARGTGRAGAGAHGSGRAGLPARPHRCRGGGAMIEVLVVDDDPRVARVNTAYVGKVPGFRVAGEAHSAAEALRQVETLPRLDLVLMDHYLPDDTGLAVVREMRRRGHQTDVIMVTAARDVSTVQAAMRHGALQYLVKPFAFAGLRAKLEAYAELRRTLDGGGEAEQAEVDRIFGALSAPSEPGLPKGHSPTTAELVRQALMHAHRPLSAQEIAERTGVSRQTAQRYLKLLERTGRARLTLKYGDAGRPEHLYVWATRA